MPSTSSTPPLETTSPICEHCGTNTGLERIDGTRVNALVDLIHERLSRDVHGNFFIEGAKTGKDTRHGQLSDLFSLLAHLQNFQSTMDRYIALHTPKEFVKAEKPATINQSMTPVIEAMVEHLTSDRFRDLSIRCDRLEAHNEATKSKGLRTAGGKALSEVDPSPNAATARKAASAEVAKLEGRLDARMSRMEQSHLEIRTHAQRIAGLQEVTAELGLNMNRIEPQILSLEQNVAAGTKEYRRQHLGINRALGRLEQIPSSVESLTDASADLADKLSDMRISLAKLKDWQHDFKRWKEAREATDKDIDQRIKHLLRRVDRAMEGLSELREMQESASERAYWGESGDVSENPGVYDWA